MGVRNANGISSTTPSASSFAIRAPFPTGRWGRPAAIPNTPPARSRRAETAEIIAIVTSKFPRSISCRWARRSGGEEARAHQGRVPGGPGNRDWRHRARVKDANPISVWVGAIGLEGNQLLDAMKIDRAAAALTCTRRPMAQAPEGKKALAATSSRRCNSSATRRLSSQLSTSGPLAPYPGRRRPKCASAWQGFDAAVTRRRASRQKPRNGCGSADTIQGKLRFDGFAITATT
jgi:branched-chain amino acid transport system substrate-binding protein